MTRTISTMALTGGLVLGTAGLAQADEDKSPAPVVQDSLAGAPDLGQFTELLDLQALVALLTGALPTDQLPTDQLPTELPAVPEVPEVPEVQLPATPDAADLTGTVTDAVPTDAIGTDAAASLPLVGDLLAGGLPIG